LKTKAYQSFKGKLDYFDDDLDFIDILAINVTKNTLTEQNSNFIFKNLNPEKHIHLSRRQNKPTSRKQVMAHLKATVYAAYVKDIYEELTHYLQKVLSDFAISHADGKRLVGDHSTNIDAATILSLGSWENICRYVSKKVFQALENERSTKKLIDKMAKKLNLQISQTIFNDALPYLEVRHCLVHSDGKADNDFIKDFPDIQLDTKGFIILNFSFIREFRKRVHNLVLEFDAKILAADLLENKFLVN